MQAYRKIILIGFLLIATLYVVFGQGGTVTVNSSGKTVPPITILTMNGTNLVLTRSTGDPNGSVTAGPGSICMDTTGALWSKTSGTGNTGWTHPGGGAGTIANTTLVLKGDNSGNAVPSLFNDDGSGAAFFQLDQNGSTQFIVENDVDNTDAEASLICQTAISPVVYLQLLAEPSSRTGLSGIFTAPGTSIYSTHQLAIASTGPTIFSNDGGATQAGRFEFGNFLFESDADAMTKFTVNNNTDGGSTMARIAAVSSGGDSEIDIDSFAPSYGTLGTILVAGGAAIRSGDALVLASTGGTPIIFSNDNGTTEIARIKDALTLKPVASFPGTPAEGMFVAKTDHHPYYYNGTTFIDLLSGGIGGSIADQQVAFGNGTNIGGDNNLTWDSSHTRLTVKGTNGGGGIEVGPSLGILNTAFSVDNDKSLRLIQFSDGSATLENIAGGGSGSSRLVIQGASGSFEEDGNGSWEFENVVYFDRDIILGPRSAPASPLEGQVYSNSSDHHPYYYNGTTFERLDFSGDALTTNPLSQFAATTSAQFKGVISDENAPDGASSKVIMALGSLSIASGKTGTFSNTLTLSGTDGSTLNIGSGGTLGSNAFTSTAYVPTSTTVNGHALSSNVTVTSSDLGGTTAGQAFFTLTNPSAITFPRINADNSVDALSASAFRTAIGAGTGGGDALTTNPLSQFAATTSAQLRGVLTDESGTGVFLTDNGSAASLTSFPTFNQNTTGSAASLSISGQTGLLTFTGLASTNRIKTVRDAADTILELGGSYTPTGTWTSLTLVTPVLGTPTSGNLANCTFPTLNQNTTGSAARLTTQHNIWGVTFDGTQNVTGGMTGVTNIVGTPSANFTIAPGAGNSLTTTFYSNDSGGNALAFITGNADQSSTFGGDLKGTGGMNITGGAGNMTITSGTGNSRTMTLKTTTSGGTATTAATISATQVVDFANAPTAATVAIPTISSTSVLTNKDLTSGTNTFPTLNQDTTGSAVYWKTSGTGKGAITGPATGTTRTYTFPDSDQTILYSGGALGTPASGTATNLTGTASGLTAGAVTTPASLGSSTATTQSAGDNSTKIATTAYADAAGTGHAVYASASPPTTDVGLFTIAKTGVDLKTNGTTTIFTVPSGRTFVCIGSYTVVTSVTSAGAGTETYQIKESGAGKIMTGNTVSASGTPAVGTYYTETPTSGQAPFTACAAGNSVQILVSTSQAGSTAVSGTVFVVGFYSS